MGFWASGTSSNLYFTTEKYPAMTETNPSNHFSADEDWKSEAEANGPVLQKPMQNLLRHQSNLRFLKPHSTILLSPCIRP